MTQLQDEIAAVSREIRFRERVYPRLVSTGKMTPNAARSELNVMKALLSRLEALPDPERLL